MDLSVWERGGLISCLWVYIGEVWILEENFWLFRCSFSVSRCKYVVSFVSVRILINDVIHNSNVDITKFSTYLNK